jgi:hypothetical protein
LNDSTGQNNQLSNVTASTSSSSISSSMDAVSVPKKKIILKRKPFLYENSSQDETDAKKSKQTNK